MKTKNWVRFGAALMALSLLAAACGDSDSDENTTASGDTIADVCPNPLVVQTDWFPEPEHGYTYDLIGPDGELDAEAGIYTGPLGDTGIDLEVRAGGPYIGFSPPSAQFYSDDDIFMAYVDTATAMATSETLPVVAVFAPFEVGPQILMWNPEVYSFETFQDIGDSDAPVLYFEGGAYMTYLLGQGFLNESQIDASYDGSPARFLTEDVVQQGFASNEPWRYENTIEDWLKPVDFMLIHDSGFEIYEGTLSVKPESITDPDDSACLELVVPLFQQSQVDYMNNPEAMNVRLNEIVTDLASFWTASEEGHAAGTKAMKDLGLVSDGPDSTVGNMVESRIQELIDTQIPFLETLGIDTYKEGLQASDIFTNQFIDESIGLGF
ncbi:MAG: ABC transporter substrate-binding protein [Actinobacteria bacterium]|nr:ABC transporter substrate-binding protein [Actinomycetota bacterium]